MAHQSNAGFCSKAFRAKELPQPHADSESGLLVTTNELLIISSTKSIVEPRTNSNDPSSTTRDAPLRSNIKSLGSCSPSFKGSSSKLYWKPEQPPPSTDSLSLKLVFFCWLRSKIRFAHFFVMMRSWRAVENCDPNFGTTRQPRTTFDAKAGIMDMPPLLNISVLFLGRDDVPRKLK